jgi:hypothetical protein
MAQTTFSGPVRSLAGFITAGVNSTISLTADTTLTVAAHAGKIILLNDADGKFTLPSINVNTPTDPTPLAKTTTLALRFSFMWKPQQPILIS